MTTQGQVQLKAAVLFLCELVRWMSVQKQSEKTIGATLCQYSFELKTDDYGEPLRRLCFALEYAFFDGDVEHAPLQQAC